MIDVKDLRFLVTFFPFILSTSISIADLTGTIFIIIDLISKPSPVVGGIILF